MSGPKSGGWRVVPSDQGLSAGEAQKVLHHYLECILQYRKQLEELQRRHPELQIHYDIDAISPDGPGSIQAITSELNHRYEIYIRLRDEIKRVEGIVAARDRAKELIADVVKQRRDRAKKSAKEQTESLASIREKAEKVFSSLAQNTAPDQRSEIEESLRICLGTEDSAKADLLFTNLRVRIRQSNHLTQVEQQRLVEKRDRDAHAARDLLLKLDSLNKSATPSVNEELTKVVSGERALTDDVRVAAEVAITEGEREFADNVLKHTLEQLGYEVQEGFETLFEGGGSAFFQRASWGEHHVRVTANHERQRLSLDVVRFGTGGDVSPEQALRDKEMETHWCGEVEALVGGLARQGVLVDLDRKLEPGAVALQVIEDERLRPSRFKQRRGRPEERGRAL